MCVVYHAGEISRHSQNLSLVSDTRRYYLMFLKPNRSQRGFTMIEILMVVAIIGVLTTISLVTYGQAKERARLHAVKNNVSLLVLSLDDFARDHQGKYPALTDYHSQLATRYIRDDGISDDGGNLTTDPGPPGEPLPNSFTPYKRRGNAIIGGGPPLADTSSAMQDDFYTDFLTDWVSAFRLLLYQPNAPADGPMIPIDALAKNGHLSSYPTNPLAGPGVPMVNIAHMLYDYDAGTNDYNFIEFTVMGESRLGFTAARPGAGGLWEPYQTIWTEENYPKGDFAYIPFDFSTMQGTHCNGYWIICYGDLGTLRNGEYNKYSLYPDGSDIDPTYQNWPNFPPPYGDGDPTSPPMWGGIDYEVKRLMLGALDVRATIFEDQFTMRED